MRQADPQLLQQLEHRSRPAAASTNSRAITTTLIGHGLHLCPHTTRLDTDTDEGWGCLSSGAAGGAANAPPLRNSPNSGLKHSAMHPWTACMLAC